MMCHFLALLNEVLLDLLCLLVYILLVLDMLLCLLNFPLSFVMRQCSSLGEDVDDQLPMIYDGKMGENVKERERRVRDEHIICSE